MGEGGTMEVHNFLCPSPFINWAMGLPAYGHIGKNAKKQRKGKDAQKGREVVKRGRGTIRKFLKEKKTSFWKIIKKDIQPVDE